MRFEVPQFIDVKERIIGPLTGPQAMFMAGGIGAGYIAVRYLPGILGYAVGAILLGFGATLAFVQINSRSFPDILYAVITHYIGSRLFIWQYVGDNDPLATQPSVDAKAPQASASPIETNRVTDQKIRDIAWGLDVLDKQQ